MFSIAKVAVLLLQFFVLSVFGQTYFDIPVSYVTPKIQKPAANEITTWNASICRNAQERYNGMTAVVNFNLPLNLDWNPIQGVVYANVSNSTSLSPVLCRNHDGSTMKNSCTFTYETAMGPNIYISIQAGNEGHVWYSTGITFVESGLPSSQHARLNPRQENEIHEMATRLENQKAVDAQSLFPVARLQNPGIVHTGDAVYYTFTICPSSETGTRFTIEIVVVGVEPDDAFSSYVCKAKPCAPDNSNVIVSDVSDSSLNALTISYDQIRPTGTVYVLIVGFGGKEENQFNLGAVVRIFA